MKQLPNEEAHIWSLPQLNGLSLFRARIVTYAFKRHMHDFFVVGLIENGVQKFSYRRAEHFTPPTGIIVLNPGEAHTGESAVQGGFEYRAFYPDTDLMRRVASDIQGFEHDLPFFGQPVIHDAALFQHIYNLHRTLETNHPSLEQESRLVWVLAQLITRHADAGFRLRPVKPERYETRRIRQYIEDHYAEDIRLDELAALVH
ncbi:MAG: AraC family transcriptional regulator, partial [Anaerolineae bacterium]